MADILGPTMAMLILACLWAVAGTAILQAFREEYGPTTFRFKWQANLTRFAIILFWPPVGVYLFYKSNMTHTDNFL